MEKKGENSTKFSEAIAKMPEAGLSVTDQTKMGRGVGFIGRREIQPQGELKLMTPTTLALALVRKRCQC